MGVIQKLGNFLGVNKFAQSLASTGRVLSGSAAKDRATQLQSSESLSKLTYALRNEKDPEKKARLAQLAQSQLNMGIQTPGQIDPGMDLSKREILGSAANVALNVATPGAFKGAKTAIIAKNAALGAGFGAASGLEKNRDLSGIVGSTVGGALVGTALGGAGLIAKAGKDFLGKTTPEWLMNKAVKPALQDLKKNVKYGSDTLGKQLLDEGVKGGPKKLLEIANTKTQELENQLQDVLAHPGIEGAKITRKQIAPYLDDLLKQKAGVPGLSKEVAKIKSILADMPENMTLQEANVMKRRIYSELQDVAYKLDAKLSVKGGALKQIARGLKTEIENTVGGTVVRDINRKLSIYGKLENAMVDKLAREMRNNGIGLTDAILASGGGATTALALLRHAGTGITTTSAQGLKGISKVGTGIVGKTIKGTVRKAMLNIP